MTCPLLRTIAEMPLAAALLSLLAVVQPSIAQQLLTEEDARAFAEAVQSGSLPVSQANATCAQRLEDGPDAKEVREVMSAFLGVPEAGALDSLCQALVRAVIGGDLTAVELAETLREGEDAERLLKVGRFLRTIYFSHTLATAASAEEQVAR